MAAQQRAGRLALALGLVLAAGVGSPALAGSTKPAYVERGEASYYGAGLHGRKMADGKHFNRHRLTAAHRRLPLGSKVTVTNLENGRSVEVEVRDRGPYAHGRVIDLSEAAAARIGLTRADGTAPVLIVASAR